MNVLAIQGSPHRGNTYERVERFGEVLKTMGNIEFEHVELRNLHLEPCRGCFLCFERGEEHCPLADDRKEIARKLDEADGVVFATPVYAMHVSSLFKRFVDRFAYTFHRPRYFGAYAVGLGVTGAVGLRETLGYLKMLAGSWGFEYLGDLGYTSPPVNTKLAELPPMRKGKDRTEKIARKLHRAMREKPPRKLTANDYLHFHALRALYRRMEEYSPTDFAYYRERGWLDPGVRYFTPHVRGSAFKSAFPRLFGWFMGRSIDKALTARRTSLDRHSD